MSPSGRLDPASPEVGNEYAVPALIRAIVYCPSATVQARLNRLSTGQGPFAPSSKLLSVMASHWVPVPRPEVGKTIGPSVGSGVSKKPRSIVGGTAVFVG